MSKRNKPKPKGYHWDKRNPTIYKGNILGCRWCKRPVPRNRSSWCGRESCLHEWKFRTDHKYFRLVIYGRDHGICNICGFDTNTVNLKIIRKQILYMQECKRISLQFNRFDRIINSKKKEHEKSKCMSIEELLEIHDRAINWSRTHKSTLSPWEADHIVPIVLGGDWFDLKNIRTLCVPCHREETAKLNRILLKNRNEVKK